MPNERWERNYYDDLTALVKRNHQEQMDFLRHLHQEILYLMASGSASSLSTQITQLGEIIMAGVSDIKTAQAAEKADLAILVGLVPQILTAIANGNMTAADAQAILDEINAEDADVKSTIDTLQKALTPSA